MSLPRRGAAPHQEAWIGDPPSAAPVALIVSTAAIAREAAEVDEALDAEWGRTAWLAAIGVGVGLAIVALLDLFAGAPGLSIMVGGR